MALDDILPKHSVITIFAATSHGHQTGCFIGYDAIVYVSIFRGDDIVDESWFNGIARTQDVREQLFLGFVVDSRQVGSDATALHSRHVTTAAIACEEYFPVFHISLYCQYIPIACDQLATIRTCAREQGARSFDDGWVGIFIKMCPHARIKSRWFHLAAFDCF